MQYLRIQNPWHSPLSDEPEEGLIPCEVVRSSRKTIAIQITAEGRLVLRIPRRASVQAAMRFAEEHRDWIEVHYKEAVERQRNRKTYGAEEIRNFTEKLRPVLMHRVALYAACMGVTYGKITIRNQKTRWGSCSAAGNLNFNWRLALLPEDLMNYVIVHELAHRLEMNHSARFWTQVENILPDWRERRVYRHCPFRPLSEDRHRGGPGLHRRRVHRYRRRAGGRSGHRPSAPDQHPGLGGPAAENVEEIT